MRMTDEVQYLIEKCWNARAFARVHGWEGYWQYTFDVGAAHLGRVARVLYRARRFANRANAFADVAARAFE